MGCDIHLFVEVRDSAKSPWRLASVMSTCTWCDGKGTGRDEKECYGCKGRGQEAGYGSRNYDAFAILANVRNGSGFAGCDTGDGFIPISAPRGLPGDMSSELRRIADDSYSEDRDRVDRLDALYGATYLGDHSHSWLSLRELLNNDWTRTTKHRGQVTLGYWLKMTSEGKSKPESYCGGASGRDVRHVSPTVAEALRPCVTLVPHPSWGEDTLATATWSADALKAWHHLSGYPEEELLEWSRGVRRLSIYVPAEWTETYAESAGYFHSHFLPALAALGHDPDNVRIVFGFDS